MQCLAALGKTCREDILHRRQLALRTFSFKISASWSICHYGSQNASVQLHGTVHLTAFNILVELLNYRTGQTAHFATYSLPFKRCVCVCRSERLSRTLLRNPGFKADLLLNYKTVSVLLSSRMVQPSGRNM